MPNPGQLDSQTSQYESDLNVSSYSNDNGVLVLPVMGPPGTPPKVIQVNAGVGFRTVNWSYVKRGTPPLIPSMKNTSSGDQLLSTNLSFSVPSLIGTDSRLHYTAAGVYEYVSPALPTNTTNFKTGRHPYQAGLLAASIYVANSGREPPFDGLVDPADGTSTSTLRNFGTLTSQDWVTPTGNISVNATNIDFDDPSYEYFDTGISKLFFSDDLII